MKRILFLLISITFISCSNISLETDPIIIRAIDNGKILSNGDLFDISFDKSSNSVIVNPTSATVKIVYLNNNIRNTQEPTLFDSELTDSEPTLEHSELTDSEPTLAHSELTDLIPYYSDVDSESLVEDNETLENISYVEPIEFTIDIKETPNPQYQITSDFSEGLYTLLVTVYEDESIISEYESEFIVYSGELNGEGFSSILYEGFLSEGYNRILWDTADHEGFMNITLEIFPFKLTNESTKSENYINFPLTVNPLYKTLYDDLTLQPFYKSLYFNGNYIDEQNKDLEIIEVNSKKPKIVDNYYGMEIGPVRGFSNPETIIPIDDGAPLSFSVLLDFLPLSLDDGLIFKSNYGNKEGELFVQDGLLKYSSSMLDNDDLVVDIIEVEPLEPINLVISYIYQGIGYEILYYINGKPITQSYWFLGDSAEESLNLFEQYTTFGGTEDIYGFSAVLNTFQVYYKDILDRNNIYPNNQYDKLEQGLNYKVSEGFNSIYLPYNFFGLDNDIERGYIDGEFLYMLKGSYLDYPSSLDFNGDVTITIEANIESAYNLSLYNDSLLVFDFNIGGDCSLQRRGDFLFLNDEKVQELDFRYTGFSITAVDSVTLDSVSVVTRDSVVASN